MPQHSWSSAIKRQHPTIERQESCKILQLGKRNYSTCNSDRPDPLRHGDCGRIGIRRTARDREDSEFVDREIINELFDDARPIAQLSIQMDARPTDAGPIRGNNANTEGACRFLCELRHRARTRPAVTEYDRCSGWIAVFLKCNYTSIVKLNDIFSVHRRTGSFLVVVLQ